MPATVARHAPAPRAPGRPDARPPRRPRTTSSPRRPSSNGAASRSSGSSGAARSRTTALASWWPIPSCACATAASCCGPSCGRSRRPWPTWPASYGVAAGPRPGYPGLLGRGARARARGSWRARAARGARHHVPRHRPQRHDAPGGLRAHRPLRHGRARRHLHRPRAGLAGRRSPSRRPASVEAAGRALRRGVRRALGGLRGGPRSAPLARERGRQRRRPSARWPAASSSSGATTSRAGGWRWSSTASSIARGSPGRHERWRTPDGDCQNCRAAPNDGAWLRVLKPQAFTVAGAEREPQPRGGPDAAPATGGRRAGRRRRGSRPGPRRRRRLVGDDRGTARPPRLARRREPRRIVIEMLGLARERIDRARAQRGHAVPPGRPELGRPGRRA